MRDETTLRIVFRELLGMIAVDRSRLPEPGPHDRGLSTLSRIFQGARRALRRGQPMRLHATERATPTTIGNGR